MYVEEFCMQESCLILYFFYIFMKDEPFSLLYTVWHHLHVKYELYWTDKALNEIPLAISTINSKFQI
jgi:hypothetical protein